MTLEATFLAIPAVFAFFACILYVLFGQITVRKLRKNPETKGQLGVEFFSGWDILNVAAALSRPKWLSEKFKKSRFSFLSANYDVLFINTTLFDRILARVFWFAYVAAGTGMIFVLILHWFGFFE
ncbi:hypothetical protein [Agarivorans gilvus]|uniref:Uncharacterized protein n=1 Tax=Agarivorans gilvus TaxID=680279 RepID=A0ABQ1I0V5_9ALTE|nr:hypothetical protein [Agarivorans gilvus]GGB01939.1 hypothetical protein GCM10007414_13960 [Agarivorans gilvus]